MKLTMEDIFPYNKRETYGAYINKISFKDVEIELIDIENLLNK